MKTCYRFIAMVLTPMALTSCPGSGVGPEDSAIGLGDGLKTMAVSFTEEQVRGEMVQLKTPMAQQTSDLQETISDLEGKGRELKRQTQLTAEVQTRGRTLYNYAQQDLVRLRSSLANDVRSSGGEIQSPTTRRAASDFESSAQAFERFHYEATNDERGLLTLLAVGVDWLFRLKNLQSELTMARREAMARIIENSLAMQTWEQL